MTKIAFQGIEVRAMSEHLLHAMVVDAVGLQSSAKRIFNDMHGGL